MSERERWGLAYREEHVGREEKCTWEVMQSPGSLHSKGEITLSHYTLRVK